MAPSGKSEVPDLDAAINEIRKALSGLQFGTVSIAVQDGVVVQIDRTEKRRFVRRRPKSDQTSDQAS